ncbi:MAG: DUF6624 domain-containing protein [Pseudomonadota bacterium]
MGKAIKSGLIAILSLTLIAADDPPESGRDYPDPPPIVADRIVDGRFEPGDLSYLRGAYPGASAVETAEWQTVKDWLDRCGKAGRERLDARLTELGVKQEGETVSGAANLCQQVIQRQSLKGFENFSEIEAALPAARIAFNTLVETIRLTELRVGPVDDRLARELEVRTLADQLLRFASSWGDRTTDGPRLPQLNEAERTVFRRLVWSEITRVDYENTRWLDSEVRANGWPKKSEVGERAASSAWLLVQHADQDPTFQYRALRLMEPLLDSGEVEKGNYAYLYDRVMLKLNGKQRYATQVRCSNGERAPRPLEEPERIDELRKSVGMVTLAEYLTWFSAPCPS